VVIQAALIVPDERYKKPQQKLGLLLFYGVSEIVGALLQTLMQKPIKGKETR
jgi:hypothetical protein